MRIYHIKIGRFFKSISNGILGISAEVLLAVFFIFTGFMVCLFWWGVLIR